MPSFITKIMFIPDLDSPHPEEWLSEQAQHALDLSIRKVLWPSKRGRCIRGVVVFVVVREVVDLGLFCRSSPMSTANNANKQTQ